MACCFTSARSAGFTLIELSIVLVIIGLLVGGILTGQSLIRASELRSVQREFTNYQTVIGTFKDKYFALPGDMPNAWRYWGVQAGASVDGYDSTCAGQTSTPTGTATCNGNGDGILGDPALAGQPQIYEDLRFWQHLSNASLVDGRYTGVPSGVFATIGVNIPQSKFPLSGWFAVNIQNSGIGGIYYASTYGLILQIGAVNGSGLTLGPTIKPEDAYNLDVKADDGLPATGRIMTNMYGNTFSPNCANSSNTGYNLSITTNACSLIYKTGYSS